MSVFIERELERSGSTDREIILLRAHLDQARHAVRLSRTPAWVEQVDDTWCLVIPAVPCDDELGHVELTAALSTGKRVAISLGHFRGHAFYRLFHAGRLQTHHFWGTEPDGTEPASWTRALGYPINAESLATLHAIPTTHAEGVLKLLARVTRTPDPARFLTAGYVPEDSSLIERESWYRLLILPGPDEPRWLTTLSDATRTRPRWYRVASLAAALVQAALATLIWLSWVDTGSGWTLAASLLLTTNAFHSLWSTRPATDQTP